MEINKPQSNAPMERVHQVILNMLVTKYLDNNIFYYIYPWVEALASIAWAISDSCPCTIEDTLVQAVFGRDMISNLAAVEY